MLAYLKGAKGIKKLAIHWTAQPALKKLVLAFMEVIRSWTMGERGRMPFEQQSMDLKLQAGQLQTTYIADEWRSSNQAWRALAE